MFKNSNKSPVNTLKVVVTGPNFLHRKAEPKHKKQATIKANINQFARDSLLLEHNFKSNKMRNWSEN